MNRFTQAKDQTRSKPKETCTLSPILYLLVSLAMTSLMLGIVFLIAWSAFGRRSYILAWSIAFWVGTFQWMNNIFSSQIYSDRAIYWLVVNAAGIVIVTLSVWGHLVRTQRLTNVPLLISLALFVELLITFFTLVKPHVGLQMSIGVYYASLGMLVAAWAILSYRPKPRLDEWGAGSLYAIFALVQACAGTAALMQGAEFDETYRSIYSAINFLALPSAYTGLGLFVVLMVASDLSDEMRTLAMTDQLTQVMNRRGFYDAADKLCLQSGSELNLLICDMDNFKQINDRYGHAVGDTALIVSARTLQKCMPESALLGRISSDQFAIVVPDSDSVQALELAERMRRELELTTVREGNATFNLSASIGVTSVRPSDDSIGPALLHADQAMHTAKAGGRNRVERYNFE